MNSQQHQQHTARTAPAQQTDMTYEQALQILQTALEREHTRFQAMNELREVVQRMRAWLDGDGDGGDAA